MIFEILRYVSESGEDVFGEWLARLTDNRTRAKVVARIARLGAGNFGDCKMVREGVLELRIDSGPGYRIYFARIGRTVVLLLCGGDKRQQSKDIDRAVACLNDYNKRAKKP